MFWLLSMRFSVFLFAFLALFPRGVFAVEMRLVPHDTARVHVGDVFLVDLLLDSGEGVNAIEGTVHFPSDALGVREIRDGNSMVNFWVERPHVSGVGTIVFSGVTPGGFIGAGAKVLSIAFEAKEDGLASLALGEARALKNDGYGTSLPIKVGIVDFTIVSTGALKPPAVLADTDVPEDFTPVVVDGTPISGGKAFIAFSTQDKGSGVNFYEIKETRFPALSFLKLWKKVGSPHVLSDQGLKSHVFLKAIDFQGNERVVKVAPVEEIAWYEYVWYWFIIIWTACLLVCCVKLWKKK